MIHHLVLLTTKPEVIPTKLEEIMVETRIRLLKIPEVNNLRVGKRVDTTNNPHTCFFLLRRGEHGQAGLHPGKRGLRPVREANPRPLRRRLEGFDYEMEPGKDVRYSFRRTLLRPLTTAASPATRATSS
jgi:hypothetical protein